MKNVLLLSLVLSRCAVAGEPRACRVLDETGAVIASHSAVKCQTEIRELVKSARCAPGLKLTVTYVGQGSNGKDLPPLAMNITCPRR